MWTDDGRTPTELVHKGPRNTEHAWHTTGAAAAAAGHVDAARRGGDQRRRRAGRLPQDAHGADDQYGHSRGARGLEEGRGAVDERYAGAGSGEQSTLGQSILAGLDGTSCRKPRGQAYQ